MALVSKELAKAHCRVSSTVEDDLIDLYVKASESAALTYMNRNVYATQGELDAAVTAGTAGIEPIVATEDMMLAVLLMVGHYYTNRDEYIPGTVAPLKPASKKLLEPYRIVPGV